MYKKLVIVFVLLVFVGFVSADVGQDLDELGKSLNGLELSDSLVSIFGNERINFYVSLNLGGDVVRGLIFKDGVFSTCII